MEDGGEGAGSRAKKALAGDGRQAARVEVAGLRKSERAVRMDSDNLPGSANGDAIVRRRA